MQPILSKDFPDSWSEFVPTVIQLLQIKDTNVIQAALSALWELVSVYRFKSQESRKPLNPIVNETFPLILSIGTDLLAYDNEQAGQMMHQILKIYFASMQFELSPIQQDQASLIPWGNLFMQVIEKDLNPITENSSDRESHPWWKAKKWAYHCIYHLFSKYEKWDDIVHTLYDQ